MAMAGHPMSMPQHSMMNGMSHHLSPPPMYEQGQMGGGGHMAGAVLTNGVASESPATEKLTKALLL